MLRSDGQDALIDGYKKVASGQHCEIWMSESALKEYGNAPPNDRARASRFMDLISREGPDDLVDTQFKREGRFPGGKSNGQIAVYAIKSFQLRVYGGWLDGKPRVLLCPEVTIKKQNKADQVQLRRVAKKIGEKNGNR